MDSRHSHKPPCKRLASPPQPGRTTCCACSGRNDFWQCGQCSATVLAASKAALTGSMAAIGGVKGVMLALMVELVCVALTGARFGFENDSFFEPGAAASIGHALLAIDPAALGGADVYYERIETLLAAMLADEGVRLPGARRRKLVADAQAGGIAVPDALLRQLRELAGMDTGAN